MPALDSPSLSLSLLSLLFLRPGFAPSEKASVPIFSAGKMPQAESFLQRTHKKKTLKAAAVEGGAAELWEDTLKALPHCRNVS